MKDSIFDDYASHYGAITPEPMKQMYQGAVEHLYGRIVDCGSGPCKLAPYLLEIPDFVGYVGIDYSREMVALGETLLNQLDDDRFEVHCGNVETIRGEYDCAVSLQSLYAWPSPVKALSRIHQSLVPGGKLVLASANNDLDIEKLVQQVSRDWLLNPLWPGYVEHNLSIAKNRKGNFLSLDCLIGELRGVGFEVLLAHTQFYQGGLNFVVCRR